MSAADHLRQGLCVIAPKPGGIRTGFGPRDNVLECGSPLRTLHAFLKAEVAQISNLVRRRLPVGWCWNVQALADWKSAIRQTRSLRYEVPSGHDPYKAQS